MAYKNLFLIPVILGVSLSAYGLDPLDDVPSARLSYYEIYVHKTPHPEAREVKSFPSLEIDLQKEIGGSVLSVKTSAKSQGKARDNYENLEPLMIRPGELPLNIHVAANNNSEAGKIVLYKIKRRMFSEGTAVPYNLIFQLSKTGSIAGVSLEVNDY